MEKKIDRLHSGDRAYIFPIAGQGVEQKRHSGQRGSTGTQVFREDDKWSMRTIEMQIHTFIHFTPNERMRVVRKLRKAYRPKRP